MVVISVEGKGTVYAQPELATLCISVSVEKPTKEESGSICRSKLSDLRNAITPLVSSADNPQGSITKWHTGTMRTSSHQPYDHQNNKNLPTVYTSTIRIETTFKDFKEMGKLAGSVVSTDHVNVDSVSWSLTPETRSTKEREARQKAVRDALSKASDYASALSISQIHPSEIADAGLMTSGMDALSLGEQHRAIKERNTQPKLMMARAPAPGGAGPADEVEFQPQELSVSAKINARFTGEAK